MHNRILPLILSAVVAFATTWLPTATARAEGPSLRLIRDAEIENIIRAYSTPLFTEAGLDPNSVQVHLVNDNRLNAFVAFGQHMFINTGLLMRAEEPGQVIGVIAHETGHIAGGHLARFEEALRRAQTQSIVSMILGAAAAVAAGRADAGVAVLGAGQGTTLRSLLKYTRTQEAAADQFAVNLLDRTGISSKGMLSFFNILASQEFLITNRQDPYVRTHPITASRVEFVRGHVEKSRFSNARLPPEFDVMHRRMRAKLFGFLDNPLRVLGRYRDTDDSLESRYARSVAYHREAKLNRAMPLIDSLIEEYPNDPYFHELRGQILFESGKPVEALPSYQKSVDLLPGSSLLRTSLAAVQLELHDPSLVQPALAHLKESSRIEPDVARTWRLLATAYGRQGNQGMTALALAEEAFTQNSFTQARRQAARAMQILEKGSPPWQRAQDIERFATEAEANRG